MPRGTKDPVDQYIGARMRARRHTMGFTQTDLGDSVGVTFQQIQKYESGMNRMSVSMLLRFAAALETDIQWFIPEDISE